jgi:hypothetical protein
VRTLPPSLAELTVRRVSAEPQPIAAEQDTVVEPFDASSGFRTDAQASFADAVAVLSLLTGEPAPSYPAGWEGVVRSRALRPLVLMRVGNYPQLCDFQAPFTASHPTRVESDIVTAASQLLGRGDALSRSEQHRLNELACAAFEAGQFDTAAEIWKSVSVVAVRKYNLGVLSLAQGRHSDAATHFDAASVSLSNSAGWAELALAYTAMAEDR